jgi:acetyl esterase/lipase
LASKDKIKLNRTTGSTTSSEENVSTTPDINQHVVELIDLKLPRDPLISPMYASDEVLRKLPPVRFVACHLDPLLDDTIMFARRLCDVGGEVHSIDLIDSLPHGFLNFAPMSPDCRDGALLCLRRIKQILGYVE